MQNISYHAPENIENKKLNELIHAFTYSYKYLGLATVKQKERAEK
jgi:hypothetical protein